VVRALGAAVAERPLGATAESARRRGHAAVLLRALEALLSAAGCPQLALPAAVEVEAMWRSDAYGFAPMSADALDAARRTMRLLIFPGSAMLIKTCRPSEV
jgi:GNAT superfamily N-acetyltransferase